MAHLKGRFQAAPMIVPDLRDDEYVLKLVYLAIAYYNL
jgi:hypothetical protein